MKDRIKEATICVIGLGYVGLPVAEAFADTHKVIGYDTNSERVSKLIKSLSKSKPNLTVTSDAREMADADIIIICVPTPLTPLKEPDLSSITQTATTISHYMKEECLVILESTVYPGVTEEIVKPILEQSGHICSKGFYLGYSPERINPGDKEHCLANTTKVVAGMDDETTDMIAKLYSIVVKDVYKAQDIKTAEAAKVIENIQRDLNIALTNELAMIFQKMGLVTEDILDTAATKWNFHRYSPGLVGGHCIPVDPYYLVHRAKALGFDPKVILAGRDINDSMPQHVANLAANALATNEKLLENSRILIMGLTYKEDTSDVRESPAFGIVKTLHRKGVEVYGYDPHLTSSMMKKFPGLVPIDKIDAYQYPKMDAVIITVAHNAFCQLSLDDLKMIQNPNPILVDVRRVFNEKDAIKAGFTYRAL